MEVVNHLFRSESRGMVALLALVTGVGFIGSGCLPEDGAGAAAEAAMADAGDVSPENSGAENGENMDRTDLDSGVEGSQGERDGGDDQIEDSDCLERCMGAGRDEGECQRRCSGGEQMEEEASCTERCLEAGASPDDCRRRCSDGNECEAGCRIRARAVYDECIEQGGERDACRREAGQASARCVEQICGGEEAELPCYDACLERGFEPDDCRRRCAPADEPDECEMGCEPRRRAAYQRCIDGGGDQMSCRGEAEQVYAACVAAVCGDEPGADRRCLDDCVEGGEEPDACRERCTPAEDEANCARGCGMRARAMVERCIEDGGDRMTCREEAARAMAVCTERCESNNGDESDRLMACTERCLASGASPADCRRRCGGEEAEDRVAECTERCLASGADPADCRRRCANADEESDCEDECRMRAGELYERCVASGGEMDECRADAAEANRACIDATCRQVGGEEPGEADEQCLEACRAAGGSPDQCRQRCGRE